MGVSDLGFRDFLLGEQLGGVENCPHCGVSSPVIVRRFRTEHPVRGANGGDGSVWALYTCTTCGGGICAQGQPGIKAVNANAYAMFPAVWEVNDIVPERARTYLAQAHKTLNAPDASVVMSASSIDAMLKDHGLTEGSLYARIDKAVLEGILTQKMADWAHRVRLDANNPRHVDDATPHITLEEARRAFDLAKALTEFLYILPARMPAKTPT